MSVPSLGALSIGLHSDLQGGADAASIVIKTPEGEVKIDAQKMEAFAKQMEEMAKKMEQNKK